MCARIATLVGVAGVSLLAGACTAGGTPVAARSATSAATGPSSSTTSGITTTSTAPTPPQVASSLPTTTAPAFVGVVDTVTITDVASTYHPGCPVGPDQLRMLHIGYWGFDGQAHVGTMVVNASVAQAVLTVFSALYAERFQVHKMQPEDAYGGSDPASMNDDNTSGFNCRYADAPGPPSWSVHAYGEAIDVNPIENPYLQGGTVQPPAGASYTDRSEVRPGMAVAGGQLVAGFSAVGWQWGGRWTTGPDYQHFSATGG